ncbi:MAG: DUF3164 family protein [Phocaeicola sp.]|uniref:DUF3164 family protein n=1 Tax=Phocaeicola sp. TaxID=2773926 RepID=UPI003F9F4897
MAQNEKKQTVEMTAEEKAQFDAFRREKAKKEAEARAKAERETYRQMVDDEVNSAIPVLLSLSEDIKETKKAVLENFKSILDMKCEVLKVVKDDQRSHTFTNSEGDKRVMLGVYVTDGYRDTVEEGITIVKEYIESLADNEKTKSLVSMVLKLLSRDSKGTLKASRIVQLRKIAEDSNNDRFLEGVRIIEEAYQPAVSKQFIRAEIRDKNGMWVSIPLGMTEA